MIILKMALASAVLLVAGFPVLAVYAHDPTQEEEYPGDNWWYEKIRIEEAWRFTRGNPSVVVALIDTGVDYYHEDLRDNLVPGWDFVDNDDRPQDEFSHGTLAAGIIVGIADNQKGISGIAPYCRLMPIRVADAMGIVTYNRLIDGINYAVNRGTRIILINVSTSLRSEPLARVVKAA